jgi:starvation-inducible DNA-binding protein
VVEMIADQENIHPSLGLSEAQREGIADLLQIVLADEMTLYVKLRKYHWNVIGPQFQSLHELFEEQYEALAETIDEVAERSRSYGAYAIGTMDEFAKHARLSEQPGNHPDARQMVKNLAEDHEAMVRHLRMDANRASEEFKDIGGEDFLTALLQDHQEMAWMLRTFLMGHAVHK